jgi:hypothetical protein
MGAKARRNSLSSGEVMVEAIGKFEEAAEKTGESQ